MLRPVRRQIISPDRPSYQTWSRSRRKNAETRLWSPIWIPMFVIMILVLLYHWSCCACCKHRIREMQSCVPSLKQKSPTLVYWFWGNVNVIHYSFSYHFSSVATIFGPPANNLFGTLAKGLWRPLFPGGPLAGLFSPAGPLPRSRGLRGLRYATVLPTIYE